MRALVVATVLLASGLVGAGRAFEAVPVARACSCPDCDAVRDADVIVGGRIVSWSESTAATARGAATPIEVEIEVRAVYKGAAPPRIRLLDPGSLASYLVDGKRVWNGGGGGCQAFVEDPTGKYVVLAFATAGSTAHQIFGPQLFYFGDEPAGERYRGALSRLSQLGPPRPPAAGDSPSAPTDTASNDWMYLSAIGAGFLLITLVLLLGGPRREPRDDSPWHRSGDSDGD